MVQNHKINSFGVGVLAVAFAFAPSSAGAFWFGSSDDLTVNIGIYNEASVMNEVNSGAYTGSNTANGGRARSSSQGGDSTANGGDGGNITTGDAVASSEATNIVNSNTTSVESDCGCEGDVDVNIGLMNGAFVGNFVNSFADTGLNSTDGGKAKSYASGSNNNNYRFHHGGGHGSDSNSTANGGNGGNITTGDAVAVSSAVNVVNSNITRIRR